MYVITFIIQLKSLGESWGSKPSTISQLPRGSLHSIEKLVPVVKLTAVMARAGGRARCTIECGHALIQTC